MCTSKSKIELSTDWIKVRVLRVRMRALRRRVTFLRVIYYLFVAFDKFYLLEKKFDPTRNKHMSYR